METVSEGSSSVSGELTSSWHPEIKAGILKISIMKNLKITVLNIDFKNMVCLIK